MRLPAFKLSRFDVPSVLAVCRAALFAGFATEALPCDSGPLRSCVAGLFLGNVPLPLRLTSAWSIRPPSVVGPGVLRSRQRSWDFNPFAALILPCRVKRRSPSFRSRLPFDERPPRCFLFEGSAAIYVSIHQLRRSTDHGRSFRLPGLALRQAENADPGSIAPSLLPWDFPVSGLRTPDSARHGIS